MTEDILDEALDATSDEFKSLKPDYYLHIQILICQKAIANINVREGSTQFYIAVQMLESMARASKRLKQDYDRLIGEYKESGDYKQAGQELRLSKESCKKFELIMDSMFERQPIRAPGRIK